MESKRNLRNIKYEGQLRVEENGSLQAKETLLLERWPQDQNIEFQLAKSAIDTAIVTNLNFLLTQITILPYDKS